MVVFILYLFILLVFLFFIFFFFFFFFFQAEDGIRDLTVTGVQTCALPIYPLHDRRAGIRPAVGVGQGQGRGGRLLRRGRRGSRLGRSADRSLLSARHRASSST